MNLLWIAGLAQHQAILGWVGLISVVMFVSSLLLLPWLVKKIPQDYFKRPADQANWRCLLKPSAIVRNLLAVPVLLAGLAMLVLPGQGLLTLLIGVAIMEFPGKYALERRIVKQKGVLLALNWLRRKTGTPPLEI